MVDHNRSRLRNYLTWVDITLKEEHSLEFIRSANQNLHEQKGIAYGIFKDGKLIGGIGMHQWNHILRKAEVGYWIAQEEEGKGIMYDVAKAFIRFLFDQIQLNKIEVPLQKENTRSAQLAKRLNFTIEGVLRESLLMHGAFHDIVVAGLLKREMGGVNKFNEAIFENRYLCFLIHFISCCFFLLLLSFIFCCRINGDGCIYYWPVAFFTAPSFRFISSSYSLPLSSITLRASYIEQSQGKRRKRFLIISISRQCRRVGGFQVFQFPDR